MLILSRKLGQSIIIQPDIELTVLDVRGETVKIGINAPKTVKIYRQELLADIAQTNQEAGLTQQAPTPDTLKALDALLPQRPATTGQASAAAEQV